jgi:Glucodextranase, domain N/Sugar (and other) transporter
MPHFRGNGSASGGPGDEPRWTGAAKDGVGTAHSMGGLVWFTIGQGILTEVYYPTIDRPQMRNMEFLFCDGNGLFLEEKRDLGYQIERILPSQGYRISRHDSAGRFSFVKEIIAEPARPCVLIHTKLEGKRDFLKKLKTYVLCAPHLEVGGDGNNAYVAAAMSTVTVTNWGMNLVVSVTFLSLVAVLGDAGTFWLYGIIAIAAWIFFYRLVPETNGKTLEQIEAYMRSGKHPRGL